MRNHKASSPIFRVLLLLLASLTLCVGMATRPARAQSIFIPNFWDPNERLVRPETGNLPRLKFLTTTDFPPFNFVDRKKRLTGFHVDLARAICEELDLLPRCQIQALPWNELQGALEKGEGEAIIAGLEVTPESRDRFDFSRAYLQVPARFVTLREAGIGEPVYESLFRKTVGLVAGSRHEAFFRASFGERRSQSFPTRQMAFNALRAGQVDAVFTDAVSASFWLQSLEAGDCCAFAGGPYLSETYFGHGMSIAVAKGNDPLVAALDYALKAINDNGTFRELYLRYFPAGLF